jgi:hypothetical protein
MTVRPARAEQLPYLTQELSSLVTNAARQKPALCYQLDYTIDWAELGSVDFTAAVNAILIGQAGDTPDCRKQTA